MTKTYHKSIYPYANLAYNQLYQTF